MAIITADDLSLYSNLSATAATIAASLIPVIQERVTMMTNNQFLTDLHIQDEMVFNAAARTIVAGESFAGEGFAANDDIYVYNSYRNDGYYTVKTVATVTLTLASACSVVAELSGRSILITVVKWPEAVKQTASLMVEYDYTTRPKQAGNVKSHSLGPFSETFSSGDEDQWGYPRKITDQLVPYRIARLF
jgi:hypothetical protein